MDGKNIATFAVEEQGITVIQILRIVYYKSDLYHSGIYIISITHFFSHYRFIYDLLLKRLLRKQT